MGSLQMRDVILRGPKVTELRPMQKAGAGETGSRLGSPPRRELRNQRRLREEQQQGRPRDRPGQQAPPYRIGNCQCPGFTEFHSFRELRSLPAHSSAAEAELEPDTGPLLPLGLHTLWRGRVQTGVSVAQDGVGGAFRGLVCLGSPSQSM